MASKNIVAKGTTYNGVESITLPTSPSGTATFYEISDTTAMASDVALGKYFFASDGTYTQGSASGGGGGLEYESGTFIPSEKTNKPTINFLSSHSTLPFYVVIYDVTSTVSSHQDSIAYLAIMNHYGAYGELEFSNGTIWYARTQGGYINVSNPSAGGSSITSLVNNTSTGLPYFLTTTGFSPWINNSRYFYTDRTYKWIAVWAPTT